MVCWLSHFNRTPFDQLFSILLKSNQIHVSHKLDCTRSLAQAYPALNPPLQPICFQHLSNITVKFLYKRVFVRRSLISHDNSRPHTSRAPPCIRIWQNFGVQSVDRRHPGPWLYQLETDIPTTKTIFCNYHEAL